MVCINIFAGVVRSLSGGRAKGGGKTEACFTRWKPVCLFFFLLFFFPTLFPCRRFDGWKKGVFVQNAYFFHKAQCIGFPLRSGNFCSLIASPFENTGRFICGGSYPFGFIAKFTHRFGVFKGGKPVGIFQ